MTIYSTVSNSQKNNSTPIEMTDSSSNTSASVIPPQDLSQYINNVTGMTMANQPNINQENDDDPLDEYFSDDEEKAKYKAKLEKKPTNKPEEK